MGKFEHEKRVGKMGFKKVASIGTFKTPFLKRRYIYTDTFECLTKSEYEIDFN